MENLGRRKRNPDTLDQYKRKKENKMAETEDYI